MVGLKMDFEEYVAFGFVFLIALLCGLGMGYAIGKNQQPQLCQQVKQ